ncbi:MAG: S41 family peptidase, partial [Pseudomonadota bacterium]
MPIARTVLSSTLAFALVACGGDGSSPTPPPVSSPAPDPAPPPTQTPAPPPTTPTCSTQTQLDFAEAVLDQWYLFPDLLDTSVQTSNFTDVQAYLDAAVAPARAQDVDKFFTFATSIAEENELINSGSSAGFGIRLSYDTLNNRVFVLEAFEAGNGFQAGIDRGTELLAIGEPGGSLVTVSSLMASGGPQAVVDALGPSTAGTQRVLRFEQLEGAVIETTVTKSDFSLDPISDRYGVLILNDGNRQVGYLNLRTFIVSNAADQLRTAFGEFDAQSITELIIDFRYNGGGLVSVADTFGDLLGRGRVGQVWSETVFRASQSQENETRLFEEEINAIEAERIAFIGTNSTASASELVINSMIPYLNTDSIALIGDNTFGKPVGQSGFDLPDCDLRIRAVTF